MKLDGTESAEESISTCGYSNIAIIFVISLGLCLVVCPLLLGFRRLDGIAPNVGSCSAAISAACHPPEADVDAASRSVQWGAVCGEKRTDMYGDEGVGHCAFSSHEVTIPVRGKEYA